MENGRVEAVASGCGNIMDGQAFASRWWFFQCAGIFFPLEKPLNHRLATMPRVTIAIPDRTPQPYRFPLDTQLVTLGRGSENDIVIDCGSVSVRHAVMERLPGGYVLRDLGSTNGTKLDGERKDVIELRHGMVAQLGDVEFDFQLSEEERALMPADVMTAKSSVPDDTYPPALPPLSSEKSGKSDQQEDQKKDDEEKPHLRHATSSSKSSPFSLFVLFLLSAGIVFFVGLSARHHQETGSWFFRESGKPKTAPPVIGKSESAPSAGTEPAPPAGTEPAPPAGTEPAPPASTEPAPPPATEPAPPASTEPAPPASTEPAPPAPNFS